MGDQSGTRGEETGKVFNPARDRLRGLGLLDVFECLVENHVAGWIAVLQQHLQGQSKEISDRGGMHLACEQPALAHARLLQLDAVSQGQLDHHTSTKSTADAIVPESRSLSSLCLLIGNQGGEGNRECWGDGSMIAMICARDGGQLL